jgi:uncharacterized protein (DUF1697 family)
MKYAAFLRAVNVGGRVVKMDALRRVFEQMHFTNVQTFIASGNVVFESTQRSTAKIEQVMEKGLEAALGFTVTTFVRSVPELVALLDCPSFSDMALANGATLYVVFLREKPAPEAAKKILAAATDVDSFVVYDRYVFWFVRGSFSDSKFAGPGLEKTLGMPATVRNATTVRKMALKFG